MSYLRIVLLAIGLALPLAGSADDMQAVGTIANRQLTEVSGIALSTRHGDLLWAVNDSGNAPQLFALGQDGSDRGTVRVVGAANRDWEDLAAFRIGEESYLLIADSGDNEARRAVSQLYIVAEPHADENGHYSGHVRVVARLPFRFEDGPRDCEAVAVDVAGGRVLLVVKRVRPAAVYELPLQLDAQPRGVQTARRIGVVEALPRPTPREMLEAPLGAWRHQATALDISADGTRAVIASYQNLYLFERRAEQGWGDALASSPRILKLPLSQIESVAFVSDRVIAVAEGRAATLLRSPSLGN